MTPTERSLREARRRGWYAPAQCVTEVMTVRKVRRDFLGIVDMIVLDGEPGCHALQVTTSSNLAARMTKARENEHLPHWLRAGNRFSIWGWLHNAAGKWVLREVAVGPQDLA